jgi:hypothetical protein
VASLPDAFHQSIKEGLVMTYQKTAVFVLRVVGTLWIAFIAFAWGLYAVEFFLGIDVQRRPASSTGASIGYIVLGVLIVALSKPLGRLIGRGLDD